MFHRVSPLGGMQTPDLPGQSLHRITTFILALVTLGLSAGWEKQGFCAAKRGVPNIVFILADDKY